MALLNQFSPPQPLSPQPPPSQWRRQLARTQGTAALLLAALLSVAFAAWLYSPEFLLGHAAFWQQQNGDITQYMAGFNAYVQEPWHWPLLRLTSLNAPQGTLA